MSYHFLTVARKLITYREMPVVLCTPAFWCWQQLHIEVSISETVRSIPIAIADEIRIKFGDIFSGLMQSRPLSQISKVL